MFSTRSLFLCSALYLTQTTSGPRLESCHTLPPVFMGEKSCDKSLSVFATFGRELLPRNFCRLPTLWGEESSVHGTGRMRRRDRLLFIEQRQQATHPSHDTAKPARTTHKSTETKLVPHPPVLYAFNRSKEYAYLSHTLCGIN